jgi:predicted ester cyclase
LETRLSYSKVRALTRVENIAREQDLLDLARAATTSQLERLVRAYRGVVRRETAARAGGPERWLCWSHDDDGSLLLSARSRTWQRSAPASISSRTLSGPQASVRTAMTSEHNKRLVRRALEEIYANGNLELANELIHPEFVDHEPAHAEQPTGPESVKQTVRRLQGAFGGLRFEVEDEIAEGDKVVQLVVMSGRHTGPLMGREPTGKGFAVRHTYIWRIVNDKIVDHWGSRDDLGLLGQLGLLSMYEQSSAPS